MPVVKYEKKKKYRSEKTAEEYKAEKEKLSKEIEEIATNFSDNPDHLAELAEFKAKFYSYSIKNTMLIFMQNQGASFVGSFGKLKQIADEIAQENGLVDENGKPQYLGVRAGAKSIKVFAPTPITYLIIDDERIRLSEATKEQKEMYEAGTIKAVQKQAYKLVPVFDISQTLIPPEYYPQIFSMGAKSEEHREIYEQLKKYIEIELNCPVKENIDNSISLRGLCYTKESMIELNDKLKDTMRLSTLSHELGHFLMHHASDDVNIESEKPLPQREVEADIYSIMLTSHFGLPTEEGRKSHLAASYRTYLSLTTANGKEQKAIDNLSTIFSNASKAFEKTVKGLESYIVSENEITQTPESTEEIEL